MSNSAKAAHELAEVRLLQGRTDEAFQLLNRCIKIRQANLPPEDESIREAQERLIEVYDQLGRTKEAERLRSEISQNHKR